MILKTSLTGSYPPCYDVAKSLQYLPKEEQERLVRQSIKRAIEDQIELGIDVLVDGQVRNDIVSMFCSKISGFTGNRLPYRVSSHIQPTEESIILSDILTAREFAGNQQIKAHITGPMTLVSNAVVNVESGYAGKTDQTLIQDVTRVLSYEAKRLVDAGVEIIQIDEAVLTNGADLAVAFAAIQQIVEFAEIPLPILHVCGNVTMILADVLQKAPVKVLSIEGSWLKREELAHIDRQYMRACNKQFGLGCIAVSTHHIEQKRSIQSFIDQMVTRLGIESIWAIMPNCGFRLMPYNIAKEKIRAMVEAVKSLDL